MSRPSLRAIVLDYRLNKLPSELRGEWGCVLAYRPLALLLAWPLAAVNVPPIAVSIVGLLLLPLMIVGAAALSPGEAVMVICGLAMLYQVLDCLDGTLARVLSRQSRAGHFLDLASDLIFRAVFYGCLGHLANALDRPPHPNWLAVALAAAWLSLFGRMARDSAAQIGPTAQVEHSPTSAKWGFFNIAYSALSGVDTLLPFAAIGALATDHFAGLIVLIFIYSTADAGYSTVTALVRLRDR